MWLLGIGLTYCVRSLWKLYIRRKMKDKKYLDKMILVTTEGNVDQTLTLLKQIDYTDFYISGIIFLDSTGEKKIGDIPVVAAAENAVEVLQNMVVDQVFIDGSRRNSYVREIMAACNEMGITTHYNLGSNYRFSGKSIVEDFAGHTVLTTSIKFADTRQLLHCRNYLYGYTNGDTGSHYLYTKSRPYLFFTGKSRKKWKKVPYL